MKANLLFFFTGSFKIPFEGFKSKPLILSKIAYDSKRVPLPSAHACFNRVKKKNKLNK
jgi:hypothetical protein